MQPLLVLSVPPGSHLHCLRCEEADDDELLVMVTGTFPRFLKHQIVKVDSDVDGGPLLTLNQAS